MHVSRWMQHTPISDEALWAEIRAGKTEAFEQLVETKKNKVLNICYRILRNRDDAEEMAQETFVEVFKSQSRFRHASRLDTWIYQIAVSKCLSFLRSQKRQKRGGAYTQITEPDETLADTSTNPHELIEQKERMQILQLELDKLPRNQHLALVLSKYDGIGHQEIADILETTVSAVEALIHRAKANLRNQLRSYLQE